MMKMSESLAGLYETMFSVEVTTPQAERHDTGAMYTKMSVAELQRRVPEVGNWGLCSSVLL